MNTFQLKQATRKLRNGGVIAYATEAVYGLGCDPRNENAVQHLLALKQRPWQKGLILIAADWSMLEDYLAPLPDDKCEQIFATWPGPVTWLWPARPWVPGWLRGIHNTLAVRITAHSQAAALCNEWGNALVSTSANISDKPPAKTPFQVRCQFGKQLDYILPGAVGERQKPSEIRDAMTSEIIRSG